MTTVLRSTALVCAADRWVQDTCPGARPCRVAVVVGAGPAGSLAAVLLAKHGYDVKVMEKRALPDPAHRSLDRSYHLALSHRGMGALQAAGLDMGRFWAFPYRGSLLRSQDGAVQEVFHHPPSAKVLVERMELVRHIIDEAERLAPDRIDFRWGHACAAVDLAASVAHFQASTGGISLPYDILVGADGVSSQVRAEMLQQVPGMRERWSGRMHRIDKFFHRVAPPPGAPPINTHRGELDKEATVLRFYYIPSPPPLSVGLFFIHNHADGTYSGGMSFTRPDDSARPEDSGASFRGAADFEHALATLTMYPKAMRANIAAQLAARPWYTSGSTLQVSRLAASRAVLIGDAAHAVSAAFGQGVNAALEVLVLSAEAGCPGLRGGSSNRAPPPRRLDCSVLGDILSEDPTRPVEMALARYERVRWPDVHALTEMDRQAEAFAGFRGHWNLAFWTFRAHLAINGWLHKTFPGRFGDPHLVPMMTIQTAPYGAILRRIRRPLAALAAALIGVLMLLVATGLRHGVVAL